MSKAETPRYMVNGVSVCEQCFRRACRELQAKQEDEEKSDRIWAMVNEMEADNEG